METRHLGEVHKHSRHTKFMKLYSGDSRNSNYKVRKDSCVSIYSVWEYLGGGGLQEFLQIPMGSETEKIRDSKEKHRSATESARRAGEKPGGTFCRQLVPLEKYN